MLVLIWSIWLGAEKMMIDHEQNGRALDHVRFLLAHTLPFLRRPIRARPPEADFTETIGPYFLFHRFLAASKLRGADAISQTQPLPFPIVSSSPREVIIKSQRESRHTAAHCPPPRRRIPAGRISRQFAVNILADLFRSIR